MSMTFFKDKLKRFVGNNRRLVAISSAGALSTAVGMSAMLSCFAAGDEEIKSALTTGISDMSTTIIGYIGMILPSCLGVFAMMMSIGLAVKFIKRIIK